MLEYRVLGPTHVQNDRQRELGRQLQLSLKETLLPRPVEAG